MKHNLTDHTNKDLGAALASSIIQGGPTRKGLVKKRVSRRLKMKG